MTRADPVPAGARVAVGIEYDGTDLLGFQFQAQGPTVQSELEQALAHVAAAPVRIVGAGRTDAGVHALEQIAHFDAPVPRPARAWLLGANTRLPPGIVLRWLRVVPDAFHARFSAEARRYRYHIVNRPVRPVLERQTATWVRDALDAAAMHDAAQGLVGEHDFSSFRAAGCQARHAVRRLRTIEVQRHGDRVEIVVEGNAFLHHMVRNIVGALCAVGTGERPVSWPAELLVRRDRTLGAPTAHARGLVLEGIRYPARFGIGLGFRLREPLPP